MPHPSALRLHIVSDLHLSVSGLQLPQTGADVVVLAGDIARPQQAVQWALGLGRPVIYVTGNHEYYGGSISGTQQELKDLCRGTPIHVLENEALVLGGVRFLGATLWTDFMLYGAQVRERAHREALTMLRDFSRIRCGGDAQRLFTPGDAEQLFQRSRDWLAQQLERGTGQPTVVITHHAPAPGSVHPRYAQSPLNTCFVSDLSNLMDADRVALWIHGHTHDSFDYRVRGTRVVCNPRGYARDGVNENALFDPGLVIGIERPADA
nr:metallophosphoesterase [Candidimonas nitroreducens]